MNKIRTSLKLIAVILLFGFNAISAQTENTDTNSVDLNDYLGARLYKVFTDIGVPDDVICSAEGRSGVILDYTFFGLQIENKTVSVIYFWNNFPGEVFGNRIGLTKKEIESKYGKPDSEKTSSVDGSLIWIYGLKDTDRYFVIIYDENAKVIRYQIELMQ
jgi:hypothetical protein